RVACEIICIGQNRLRSTPEMIWQFCCAGNQK
ncbi:uncharacterized protein METZ01_LOCUS496535, partial [marine metagenome]